VSDKRRRLKCGLRKRGRFSQIAITYQCVIARHESTRIPRVSVCVIKSWIRNVVVSEVAGESMSQIVVYTQTSPELTQRRARAPSRVNTVDFTTSSVFNHQFHRLERLERRRRRRIDFNSDNTFFLQLNLVLDFSGMESKT
jgi:hypothetical protein